ncbi:MAG: glycoside hydrolase family 2 TIM barrel-domain containing protein [Eubacteriales bacterium]|nr:glycoside hydrolase family 2 TIM barrel-domain containing protein [Eubacteriales bacterium]
MKVNKWNDDWYVWANKDSFSLVWNVPENAKKVTLPHDAMIEQRAHAESLNGPNTGYRNGGTYTYVKKFQVGEEYKNRKVLIKFEGIYMNSFVYVNGQLAANRPYGYSTFYADIHPFLRYGEENELRVEVRNAGMSNSRWYSGSGIYRDVYWLESEFCHILPEGVRITTEEADEAFATLRIETEIENSEATARELTVEHVLAPVNAERADEKNDTVISGKIWLRGGETKTLVLRTTIENPKLWSDETPDLYCCKTKISEENVLLDSTEEMFGIRTISLDVKRGLRVNGKSVKLRGACVHHDNGLLGAVSYEESEYRKVAKLKEAGFNAIRMSHHPMGQTLLRACDALGMYVMDETFDMWTRPKSDCDYGLFFGEWWERDVEAMVRKDYNHPSVLLYSIGNEIPEVSTDAGTAIANQLDQKIKSMDATRYTLLSMNGLYVLGDEVERVFADVAADLAREGKTDGNVNDMLTILDGNMDHINNHPIMSRRLEKASAQVDIAGYNYMTERYESDVHAYPDRIIVGSETYPPQIAENWSYVEKYPAIIGDFTWTGWDYIGEAGVGVPGYAFGEGGFGAKFPCQLAYIGDLDITGFRRPMSYYREIAFGLRTAPYIAVQRPEHYGKFLMKTPWVMSDTIASWTFDEAFEGKPIVVEVYAGGDETELFVNGKSVGRKNTHQDFLNRFVFETDYHAGEVTAVSYKNGEEIGRFSLVSAKKERSLYVEKETGYDFSKNDHLCYVNISIRDENGVLADGENPSISVHVDGEAEIHGFGSADPKPDYNYDETTVKMFEGRAQLILKKHGNATVSITEESGETVEIEI